MKEELNLLKAMPWKHRVIMVCLSVLSFILCWFTFDSSFVVIKGVLFMTVLLVASYFDIRTRIIPDWIHVLILLVGLIDFDLGKSISGILIAPLPFIIMALVQEGSVGGGDVKLLCVVGWYFGMPNVPVLYMFLTIISVIYLSVVINIGESFIRKSPFVPIISCSCFFTMWAMNML